MSNPINPDIRMPKEIPAGRSRSFRGSRARKEWQPPNLRKIHWPLVCTSSTLRRYPMVPSTHAQLRGQVDCTECSLLHWQ